MSSALLNYAMEKSPSWEANRFSASQEISRILWNPNVHYRIYKCLPRAPSWARSIQSMPTHPTTWRSILIRSSNLCLDLSGCLFPFRLPSSLLLRATCPTHLILLDFITQTILGDEYRSLSSSLCSFLVLGQGAKFWWWSDCICPVCLKLLAIKAVVPRIVNNSIRNCG